MPTPMEPEVQPEEAPVRNIEADQRQRQQSAIELRYALLGLQTELLEAKMIADLLKRAGRLVN